MLRRLDLYKTLPVFIAVLLSACAATQSVTEWQDESYSGPLDSLLVIAAVDDGALRRSAEDAAIAKLDTLGVTAEPGYAYIPESAALSRDTVEAAIKGKQIDAVLVTRLLGVEQIEEYQPPIRIDHYRSYHRFHAHAMDISSPGYYRKFKLLTLETMLYDSATGKLVWSMQSETIDSDSAQDVIDAQVALTVERMQARGLLAGGGE